MIIGALAPWFGAKRTLAPEILEELGEHRVYWEPFCGSMAVLLAKPAVPMETVNDLHGDLVNLARVVQDRLEGPRLYRRLRHTLASEESFREAIQRLEGDVPEDADLAPDTTRAYWYFLVTWLGRNGIAGTNVGQTRGAGHSFAVRYGFGGGTPGKRWSSVVGSIPAWRRRLENVTVLRRDGFALLEKIEDGDGVVLYVDPPYLPETRSGLKASGGQSRYLHDFEEADHPRLAKLLRRFKRARVVLSYYDAPRLAELYTGWSCRRIEVNKGIANQSKGGKVGKTPVVEVLLVNRPPAPSSAQASLFGD